MRHITEAHAMSVSDARHPPPGARYPAPAHTRETRHTTMQHTRHTAAQRHTLTAVSRRRRVQPILPHPHAVNARALRHHVHIGASPPWAAYATSARPHDPAPHRMHAQVANRHISLASVL